MGGSSSTEQASAEIHEVETLAASTGALPMLQSAFTILSDPQTQTIPIISLQQCFNLTTKNPTCEATAAPEGFHELLDHLGSSIVDLFFVAEEEGISWIEFLRGYIKCCGRMSASISFNTLLRVFSILVQKAGLPAKLQFESSEADCKTSGSLVPADLLMLFWMCWIMSWDSKNLKSSERKSMDSLPDIDNIVLSAVVSCNDDGTELDLRDFDILGVDMQLPVVKVHMWAMHTVPNLADCFAQFVDARLRNYVAHEDKLEPSNSSVDDISSSTRSSTHLLTRGRAWAISLTLRGTVREEVLKACFPNQDDGMKDNLLYWSSIHGRGLNRFWSNIDGYSGPLLMLIAASSGDDHEGGEDVQRWIIGALTGQGFENKDSFYGTSATLYAITPVFHVFSSSGKEKNFVYSHLHPSRSVYDPHPKAEGIGFGGSIGNERIFVDEDFANVIVRHHAVDKTFQHGPLFPNQGFLPVEAKILEMEVWGLGGTRAKEFQTKYQKREELFNDQRRKIDLKTFSNWEDSPEKMMMDMMSNPNTVRREER